MRYGVGYGHTVVAARRSWAYPLLGLRCALALLLAALAACAAVQCFASQTFVQRSPEITDYQFIIFTDQANPTIITRERRSSDLVVTALRGKYSLDQTFLFKGLKASSNVQSIKLFVRLRTFQVVVLSDQIERYIDFSTGGFNNVTYSMRLAGRGQHDHLSQPAPVFYDIDQAVYNATNYASPSSFLLDTEVAEADTGTDDVVVGFRISMVPGRITYSNALVFLLSLVGVCFGVFAFFAVSHLLGWLLRQAVVMQRYQLDAALGGGENQKVAGTRADFMKKND